MRPRIEAFNQLYITAANMGGDILSDSIYIGSISSYAAQFIWSGATSPVGVVSLSGSNDDITYTQISDSEVAISGNSGSVLINVEIPSYKWVKVAYTRTSGSGGTVNCRVMGKQ